MTNYINFVLTGDKNYVVPLSVLMTSILTNTSKKFTPRFFLFTTGFSAANLKKINKLKEIRDCEIINVPVESYLHYFKNQDVNSRLNYITQAAFYRLLLFKILPSNIDKCFYMDGDMIVAGDLARIYQQFPKDKLAAFVMTVWAMTHRKTMLTHLAQIPDFKLFNKNPYEAPYLNSGIFLINLKRAKKLKIFEKILDFLSHHTKLPYPDQDALNAVIGQRYHTEVVLLDPSYNVFCDIFYGTKWDTHVYTQKQIQKAFKKPIVYHFGGPNKPWINDKAAHHYQVWWHYWQLSPFAKSQRSKDIKTKSKTKI